MKTKLNTLLNRVDTRLAACAAAAGASLAVVPNTEAVIISSGPVSINIPLTLSGVYLNVVTGANGTAAATPGWDVNPFGSGNLIFFNPTAPAGGVYVGSGGVFNLSLGALISGASTFSNGSLSGTSPNPWNFNSSNNYIGFRFQNEAAGNQIQYGWLQISLGATVTDSARAIVGYGFENEGNSIMAGQTGSTVPEGGSTLALLGLAFAGIAGTRRLVRAGEAKTS